MATRSSLAPERAHPLERSLRAALARTAAAALCVGLAGAQTPADEGPRTAGPRFRTLSRIRFARDPQQLHTLEAHFMGAHRARLLLQLVEGPSSNRVVNYRLDDDLYVLHMAPDAATDEAAAPHSSVLRGEARLELLRSFEMRRALFAWPAGLEWAAEDGVLRSSLGAAGTLETQIADDGLPTRMASFDAAGAVQECYLDVEWRSDAERRWPARFRLTFRGAPVWTEEVLESRAGVRIVDLFFVPRDRRMERAPFREGASGLEHTDQLGAWQLHLPLAARDDWSAAWSEAEAAARRVHGSLREHGLDQAPIPSLVLDAEGMPEAIRLDLVTAERPPGDARGPGWTRFGGGPAIRLGATSLAEAAGGLRRALSALPDGARVSSAVVRRLPSQREFALLVLALSED